MSVAAWCFVRLITLYALFQSFQGIAAGEQDRDGAANLLGRNYAVTIAAIRPPIFEQAGIQATNASVFHSLEGLKKMHALSKRVDLIVFPELFMGKDHPYSVGIHSPLMQALSGYAKALQAYMIVPIADVDKPGHKYNSAVFLNRQGAIIAIYRKRHITENESSQGFVHGKDILVVHTDIGRIAILICNDIYFVKEWHAAHRSGVDLVVWPSAFGGEGFLQAYARLYSFFVMPCPPQGEPLAPYDILSMSPPDSRLVGKRGRDEDHMQLIFMNLNSRVVCKFDKLLARNLERIEKAGQISLFDVSSIFWKPCSLLSGSPSSKTRRPPFQVSEVLRLSGHNPDGFTGWMREQELWDAKMRGDTDVLHDVEVRSLAVVWDPELKRGGEAVNVTAKNDFVGGIHRRDMNV